MTPFCSKLFITPLRYVLLLITTSSAAGVMAEEHQGATLARQYPECAEVISVHCGTAPSTRFDSSGRLWVAFVQGEYLYSSYSDDQGLNYSPPTRINPIAETIYADGENRPKIALGINKEIYISWTQKTEGRFSGNIRFSRSLNLGKSFSTPRTINDDGLLTSHRFDSLLTDRLGHLYLVWLDKRDRYKAKVQNQSYKGAAVYYTVSTDSGAHFSENKKLADHSCECCRIAISKTADDGAAVFWRHIFNGDTRDHAFAELSANLLPAPLKRATRDNWKIDACPHHGPALISQSKGTYGMVWFTNGELNKGIYYGRFSRESSQLENRFSLSRSPGASHADLLMASRQQLFSAWKYYNGDSTAIILRTSEDNGSSWSTEQNIATTKGVSDHPFLLKHKGSVFLSWHTAAEGLRLIPISNKN